MLWNCCSKVWNLLAKNFKGGAGKDNKDFPGAFIIVSLISLPIYSVGIASNSLANKVMKPWKELRWRRKIGNFQRRGRDRLMVWSSDVTKISSCQVNTTSRWGIKQLPETIFVIAGGNPWPPPLNDIPLKGNCVLDTVVRKFTLNPIHAYTVNVLASHAGVFRRACISSLPTNVCSTENNIHFPLFYLPGKWTINSFEIKCWQAKHDS